MIRNAVGITLHVSALIIILTLGIHLDTVAGDKKSDEKQSSDSVFTRTKLSVWVFSGFGGEGFGFGTTGLVWPIGGGSLGLELVDRYLVEGGGSLLAATSDERAFEFFLRGGVEFNLWDGRSDDGSGWRLRWLALAGYRFIRFAGESDGQDHYEDNHCVALNTGFEIMRHGSSGSGVGLRLLLGGSIPFSQHEAGWTREDSSPTSTTFVLDIYLALALAF
jgi:hypothetical protein